MSCPDVLVPRVESGVRCIVLTGAGGAFCAGGDVKAFAKNAASDAESKKNGLQEKIYKQLLKKLVL